jgi:hypothetical protein
MEMAWWSNELKHPFRDGTTHVLFEPLDFTAPAHICAQVRRPEFWHSPSWRDCHDSLSEKLILISLT